MADQAAFRQRLAADTPATAPFPSMAATSRWHLTQPPGPPAAADLSGWFTPARQQGDRDTCAHFAVTAAIEAVLARDTGQRLALSDAWLVAAARPVPGSDGAFYGDVIAAAQRHGMIAVVDGQHGSRRLQVGESKFISGPERSWAGSMVNADFLNKVMFQLGVRRTPVIVAIKLPPGHLGWRDDGVVDVVPELRGLPAAALGEVPNHIVTLTGYCRARQQFFFKNSWGRNWGQQGFGRISHAALGSPWCTGSPAMLHSVGWD